MAEQNSVFRKQSIDSVSSPEKLNDYIKAASPSAWIILGAALIFLIGVLVWGVTGRLVTTIPAGAVSAEGYLIVYIPEQYQQVLNGKMTVQAEGKTADIIYCSKEETMLTAEHDDRLTALHRSGLEMGDFCYIAMAQTDLPEGTYRCVVTAESVSPLSFIMN